MAVLTGVVASSATASLSPTGVSYRLVARDFRFRNDDGDESTATWAQPLNTDLPDISEAVNYRVRFSIENAGLTADSIINNGHLEASNNGGAYKTMGTDAYVSPVVAPPHTLNSVSTVTTLSDMDDGTAMLFVDSNGIWHLAYREWTAGTLSTYRVVIKTSITNGQTWRHHEFAIDSEEVLRFAEDNTGAILVITTSYIIRSTTSGLTWDTPVARPLATTFTFFVTVNNDYIVADLDAIVYYVSSDLGVVWVIYQNNDFPASLTLSSILYELDDITADLTVWYLGVTVSDDPVSMFRWTDTYPYSGFPNLTEDDISQRLFIGTSTLAGTYRNNMFVRLDTHFGSSMSVIMNSNAWGVEANTSIVETPELGADTYAFKAIDYIAPLWDATAGDDAPDVNAVHRGLNGELVFASLYEIGFAGSTEQLRTPSMMGWYLYGDTTINYIQYSPSVNKWYVAKTSTTKTVTCYELEWSQEQHGAHTTQQISSGSYVTSNFGYTDHNRIYPTSIPAGDTVEYEYAFRLRPSENVAGNVVCVRPSGIYQHDNVACFTIPVGHVALRGTATTDIKGDTDGPHSYPSAIATMSLTGNVLRGVVTNLLATATTVAPANVTKFGSINLLQQCAVSATAWVEHAASCDLLVNANLTLASTNTKLVSTNLLARATFTGGTPGNEIHVSCAAHASALLSPTAQRVSTAAARLQNRSLLRAQGSVDELPICLDVYQRPTVLLISEALPLNVLNIPATLTVSQPPVPDLLIIKKPPTQVYIYETT